MPYVPVASPSSRRAWIEIFCLASAESAGLVALLAEGVDRNAFFSKPVCPRPGSPSSRRAWIEIFLRRGLLVGQRVALLAEGVDRNFRLLI